jgi:hypothetical protein
MVPVARKNLLAESGTPAVGRVSSRRAFSLEQLFPSGGFGESSFSPRFHPGFTPMFESEGSAISLALGSELVASKQVTQVRFPSPAPPRIQRYSART